MFTGIVEQVGRVAGTEDHGGHRALHIAGEDLSSLPVGASIAVNGVCLTVVTVGNDQIAVNVVPETLDRTNLGSITTGSPVNLERPMPASGR